MDSNDSLDKNPDTGRRIAIVTGASRRKGIGAAICLALAKAGVDVFFTHWVPYDKIADLGPEEDTPAYLQEQLRALGVRCEHIAADLSDISTPTRVLDVVEERLGVASILVNNATHDPVDIPFDQLDAATLDAYYAVNMR